MQTRLPRPRDSRNQWVDWCCYSHTCYPSFSTSCLRLVKSLPPLLAIRCCKRAAFHVNRVQLYAFRQSGMLPDVQRTMLSLCQGLGNTLCSRPASDLPNAEVTITKAFAREPNGCRFYRLCSRTLWPVAMHNTDLILFQDYSDPIRSECTHCRVSFYLKQNLFTNHTFKTRETLKFAPWDSPGSNPG